MTNRFIKAKFRIDIKQKMLHRVHLFKKKKITKKNILYSFILDQAVQFRHEEYIHHSNNENKSSVQDISKLNHEQYNKLSDFNRPYTNETIKQQQQSKLQETTESKIYK
jgi:hypothetical protein